MKICPYCDKKIQDKVSVCPYCGKSLKPSLISRIKTNPRYTIGFIAGIIAMGLIIFGAVYTANRLGLFATKPSCFEQSQAYLSQFMPLFSQWTAADQKTHELTSKELDLQVIILEGIRQQIIELNPPACAQAVHKLFTSYMDETLDGYNSFTSGESKETVQGYIDKAAEYYTDYHSSVLELYPELSISPTP